MQLPAGQGAGEQGRPLGLMPGGKLSCLPAGVSCGDGDMQEGVAGSPGCHGPPEPLCRAATSHGVSGKCGQAGAVPGDG